MKKSIFLLVFISLAISVMAQKTMLKPPIVADTVLQVDGLTTHLTYTWPAGMILTQAVDSMKNDTVSVPDYFSTRGSNSKFYLNKRRIVGTDTIYTIEEIQQSYLSIYTLMNTIYSSTLLAGKLKASLIPNFHKKISQK